MIKELLEFLKGLLLVPLQLNDSLIAAKFRSKYYATETKIMTGVIIKNASNYEGSVDVVCCSVGAIARSVCDRRFCRVAGDVA